jgi:membrane peptidoglycan carboxypeptidase
MIYIEVSLSYQAVIKKMKNFVLSILRIFFRWQLLAAVGVFVALGVFVRHEINTSALQSQLLTDFASKLSYSIEPGPSDSIVFPEAGPFNRRRGYSNIPQFQHNLEMKGYEVTEQAHFSPHLIQIVKHGLTPPYEEPPVTGLIIRDSSGNIIYDATIGSRVFESFKDIPPLIAKTLLYIEDRELNTPRDPRKNPVVDWDRFARASILYGVRKMGLPIKKEGGSTLATQLEKYRYSSHGSTSSVFDKLRQMTSASIKVYSRGLDTREARRRIVLDYLNSAPLAATPNYGEIYGIGEGLYAWYGTDLYFASHVLTSQTTPLELKAKIYKQVLSLICAVRAPTYYLIHNPAALEARMSKYITILQREGILESEFADQLRKTSIAVTPGKYISQQLSFALRKAVNSIRNDLMQTLGVSRYYDLNLLHMEVDTTIDVDLQEKIGNLLRKLKDDDFVKQKGLKGKRLLKNGDAEDVVYSCMLFERTPYGNALRVNIDSQDQPFDINTGMKLELGSTAKLRTLAHYLEVMEILYKELSGRTEEELNDRARNAQDPLTKWSAKIIKKYKTLSLDSFLNKSLNRKYSASPYETFFTGGGLHTFHNFNKYDNSRRLTVKEATIHSTNLVYIRMMRDLVRYHKARLPYDTHEIITNMDSAQRRVMLEKIVQKEEQQHLKSYYRSYRNLTQEEIINRFLGKNATSERYLTILFYAWGYDRTEEELTRWLMRWKKETSPEEVQKMTHAYANPSLGLADYAFLLRRHPLQLWCVGQLMKNPEMTWQELYAKSDKARKISSSWLFKKRNRKAQNLRLRIRFERDAFARMTPYWQKLGFPFDSLIPSYATSIGSSSDRPAALAELMGIIINDGMLFHNISITHLRIADGTPYHTDIALPIRNGYRVMSEPVARAIRSVIMNVVERGTAQRLNGAFRQADGKPVKAGGKTGSGDNRVKRYNRYGHMISSRAVNRTATFVFFIDNRFFGVVTAFVSGKKSGAYTFTSALPVTILKMIAPSINSRLIPEDKVIEENKKIYQTRSPDIPENKKASS